MCSGKVLAQAELTHGVPRRRTDTMRPSTFILSVAALVGSACCASCAGSSDSTASATAPNGTGTQTTTGTTPPAGPVTLATHNPSQAATVGAPFSYDATRGNTTFKDAAGKGLTYTVTLVPAANGLVAAAGKLSGTPATTGLVSVTITATDGAGATATDAFDVIAFAAGLATPTLDPSLKYSDADGTVPAHFRAAGGPPGGGGGGGFGGANAFDNTPASNPVTNAGAALGRVLFYDKRLSANDAQACASCHVQSRGFADTARLSGGFKGGFTGRHSMSLANARYYARGRFFWDERAVTLEDQVLRPIQDTVEMGMTLDLLEKKLAVTTYYPALFTAAFGTSTITRDRISLALAQFVRSLVSGGAKFDQALTATGGTATVFTAQEQQGFALFGPNCVRCHTTVALSADDIHNTGLDATITDVGAGGGRFKVPSLRNVAVRGRFMHDGRFTSLDQVVAFYDSGVQPNPALDPRLTGGRGGQPQRLNLSAAERAALVAFLGTLTDPTFLGDRRFGTPFSP